MELLAPVGTFETFNAAIDAGADAVYVGAPDINARSLSRDLRFDEIGAMLAICRQKNKKLYLAANSLIRQKDLRGLIKTLSILEALEPDGLIIQDLGLINIVSKHFPSLPLHGSTLMGAHNRDCVELFGAMGCERVVLARELTLDEIESIAKSTDSELEVFIHGAMCFSYSGFCLFSSFLGGKSGLRGRCVQPCRRRYAWGGKESVRKKTARKKKGYKSGGRKPKRQASGGGYLFSMNDLSGLEAVPRLKNIGIASLKIEGRLRTAHYVSSVVKAYRLMIDADERGIDKALKTGSRLIDEAMSRKVSKGFFQTPQPLQAITPFHSGNMGIHLGRLRKIKRVDNKLLASLFCKSRLDQGDRLRCHFEQDGERLSFRAKRLYSGKKQIESAQSGKQVEILLPDNFPSSVSGKVELFKVDVVSGRVEPDHENALRAAKKKMANIRSEQSRKNEYVSRQVLDNVRPKEHRATTKQRGGKNFVRKQKQPQRSSLELWLRLDSAAPLLYKLPIKADRYILQINQQNVSAAGRLKQYYGKSIRNIIWSLPPILLENEQRRLRRSLKSLIRSGYVNFQIGHISQIDLFQNSRVHLNGDYTLNLMNHLAIDWAARGGLEATQLSIELDRGCLEKVIQAAGDSRGKSCKLGLCVYGTPPLFTARLAPKHFQYERQLTSPKNEEFVIKKMAGFTQTFSRRPFSLLPYLPELKKLGLDYAVIDLSNMNTGKKELIRLADILAGRAKHPKLPTFNYLGRLE